MLIFVASLNLCIMKCGLMGKIGVPWVLRTTKWFLLCNKEHIKLVAVFLSYLWFFIILYRSICSEPIHFMVTSRPNNFNILNVFMNVCVFNFITFWISLIARMTHIITCNCNQWDWDCNCNCFYINKIIWIQWYPYPLMMIMINMNH